jgi:hypothetical protein
VDANGQPTTDPNQAKFLVPFGQHKGYGLALMNEIIGGFIGGSLPTIRNRWTQVPEGEKGTCCFFFQVWKPEAMSAGAFARGRNQSANVKAVLADILGHGNEGCMLPGQLEAQAAARCAKNGGLLFSEAEIHAFNELAAEAKSAPGNSPTSRSRNNSRAGPKFAWAKPPAPGPTQPTNQSLTFLLHHEPPNQTRQHLRVRPNLLGEVMLRLDPGEGRIRTAREFTVWEGGGEYNTSRGLRKAFGLRTAVVTAFVDNEVGHLVEDFIMQGGVATDFIKWREDDGIGRTVRNGLNFTERGFGIRGAVGNPDRGNTAASAAEARRHRLGPHLRQARRALVPYGRNLRGALRHDRRTHG